MIIDKRMKVIQYLQSGDIFPWDLNVWRKLQVISSGMNAVPTRIVWTASHGKPKG